MGKRIQKLEVKQSRLKNIKADAFNSNVFKNSLTFLSINNRNYFDDDYNAFHITTREAFNGLTSLSVLTIRSIPSLQIFDFPMIYLNETLVQLTITHLTSSWDMSQLLSKVIFINIKTVDFRNNNFPSLNQTCFSGIAEKVEILYLLNSKIEQIEMKTFDDFKSLQELYLQENILKTLPENIFSNIIQLPSLVSIVLRENPWNCECDIMPLQTTVVEYIEIFPDELRCSTPEDRFDVLLIKIDDVCLEERDSTFDQTTFDLKGIPQCNNPSQSPFCKTSTRTKGNNG